MHGAHHHNATHPVCERVSERERVQQHRFGNKNSLLCNLVVNDMYIVSVVVLRLLSAVYVCECVYVWFAIDFSTGMSGECYVCVCDQRYDVCMAVLCFSIRMYDKLVIDRSIIPSVIILSNRCCCHSTTTQRDW